MRTCLSATIAGLIGALLLTACTAGRRTKVLSIFFDGVEVKAESHPAEIGAAPAANEPLPEIYRLARAAPSGSRHEPFVSRECILCHESNTSEKLRSDLATLCVDCHKPIYAPAPFAHPLVRARNCLACHMPHVSSEMALLIKPEGELCSKCHSEQSLRATPEHAMAGDAACHSCHAVHRAQTKFLLNENPAHPIAKP